MNRRSERRPIRLTERGEDLVLLSILILKSTAVLVGFLAVLSLVGAIENGLIP